MLKRGFTKIDSKNLLKRGFAKIDSKKRSSNDRFQKWLTTLFVRVWKNGPKLFIEKRFGNINSKYFIKQEIRKNGFKLFESEDSRKLIPNCFKEIIKKVCIGISTNVGPTNIGRYKHKTYKRRTVQTSD